MKSTSLTLNKQTRQKLTRAAEQTGDTEAEVVNKALDMFLITEELAGLKQLTEDMSYWQQRYLDTLVLEDKRVAKLNHDEG